MICSHFGRGSHTYARGIAMHLTHSRLHLCWATKSCYRIWLTALLMGALLIIAMLSACGGGEEPTGDGSGPAPSTQTQNNARMSLDEYLEVCAARPPAGIDLEGEGSIEDFQAALGESIERLESVEPPEEIADWHDAVLPYQRAIKESIDDYLESGDGESIDDFILATLFPLAFEYQPPIDRAISGMDADVRSRMIEAGCIDEELAGESAPQIDATLLTVGESFDDSVDNPDLANRYTFQGEQGARYLIEVARQSLPDFVVTLPVTLLQFPENFIISAGREQVSLRWEAWASDTYFFQVSGDGAGTYTVGVRLDLTPISPSNVGYDWDEGSIRVSWDPVDGAEYYNVYHDDFFETGCSVGSDGNPRFCDEVATNVVGTTIVHTHTDPDANYYWVVACNQEGCSATDSNNPALFIGDGSGGPRSGGPCRPGVALESGEFCTVVIPGSQAGNDIFEVRNGRGCYGDVCTDNLINRNGFFADGIGRVGSWTIVRVPDGTSGDTAPTPVPTRTPRATPTAAPTPVPTSTPRATPTATPTPVPTRTPRATPTATRTPAATRTPVSTRTPRATPSATRTPVPTRTPRATPTATLTPVPMPTPPAGPSNVRYTQEGSSIRVNWDRVEGAEFYKVYYDDFFDSTCYLDRGGTPRFCDELATDVRETTYLHTDPDERRNYYWVVACNREGCSEVDSENPAEAVP